jgi:PAS domain S-box-containing protein
MFEFLKFKRDQVLSYRLLLYIILFSTIFTILGTSLQVWLDYKNDVGGIRDGMRQIGGSYVDTITASLWDINLEHVRIQLEGILKLPGMRYIEVRETSFGSSDVAVKVGKKPESGDTIKRVFDLNYNVDGRSVRLGKMLVVASLDEVYSRIKKRVLVILMTQGVKIFILSLFIIAILHYMVTRHLQELAEYAREIDLNHLDREFVLRRSREYKKPDEFDMVVKAFNDMRRNLIRDIAQRKKIEEALRESNKIVENSPVVLFKADYDQDWPVRLLSENISQFGYSAVDFISGKIKFLDIVHKEDRKKVKKDVDFYCRCSLDHFRQEYRIVKANGSVAWIENSVVINKDDTGVVSFMGIMMDITERKKAGSELSNLRNLLQSIVDSMPSVLVGVDGEGRIIQWNKAAREQTGLSWNDVKFRLLQELLPDLHDELGDLVLSGSNGDVTEKFKIPVSQDGVIHYKDVIVYPLLDDNSGGGSVILIDDVTVKSKLEEMMVQTEKMMSVGGLAAGMAHEINNPLGAILSGVQGTERRLSPSLKKNREVAEELGVDLKKFHEYLEVRGILGYLRGIRDAGQRAAKIVRNMLEFSRKSESVRARHEVSAIMEKSLDLAANDYDLKKKHDFKTIDIVRDYEQNLPGIYITETEVEQVLLNIMKNAAQALSEKEFPNDETPCIWLRTRREGDFVRIEIEDNGPGMDEKTRKRVFEPFYTTKPVGVGTGLGLSVSYFIITRNHDGQFRVESEKGRGTRFIIRLPVRPSA